MKFNTYDIFTGPVINMEIGTSYPKEDIAIKNMITELPKVVPIYDEVRIVDATYSEQYVFILA